MNILHFYIRSRVVSAPVAIVAGAVAVAAVAVVHVTIDVLDL